MIRRLLALAALLVMGSCASARPPRIPGEPPPAVPDAAKEGQYQEVLEHYTSHRGIYDNLDTKLFIYATWQSPQFVEARMARVATFRDMPVVEASAALERERERLSKATEIFIAIHANESKYDDFDRPDSMWRLALNVKGQDYLPIAIERVGRTNVEQRSVYSYMESFWVGYRVRFEKVEISPGEQFKFRVASALGRAELSFKAD